MSTEKPLLYFIHGWGMNQAVWQHTAAALSERFQIKLLDISGFGNKTAQIQASYNLESITHEIAADLTQPGWLIGWSLGGLVAQLLAFTYKEKVQGLITVASTPKFSEAEDWLGIKQKVLAGFQQQLAADYQKTLERFLAIQAMGSPTAKQDIKLLKQQLLAYPAPNETALAGGLEILEQADIRRSISSITQPTLRLYGRLDSLVPHKVIASISQLQPNSKSYCFAHASHAPFISHPEEFISEITQFIAQFKL